MENLNKEDREFLLWRYLHNDLSEMEQKQVSSMIESSEEWKLAFKAMEIEEATFAKIESEQPSVRFSKNVMEAIAQEKVVPSVKSYINTKLMKWIGASLVSIALIVLIYTLAILPWNIHTHEATSIDFKLPNLSTETSFLTNSYLLYTVGFIFICCLFIFYSKLRDLKHRWN